MAGPVAPSVMVWQEQLPFFGINRHLCTGKRSRGQRGFVRGGLAAGVTQGTVSERGFSLPTSGVRVPPTSAAPSGCSERLRDGGVP